MVRLNIFQKLVAVDMVAGPRGKKRYCFVTSAAESQFKNPAAPDLPGTT